MTSPELPGTPPRPARPEYGEYAEPGDPRFIPPVGPPVAVPAPVAAESGTPARRRDALASSILLALGFLWTFNTVVSALQLDDALRRVYELYGGTGDYEPAGDVGLARSIIIASHVILYAATFLITRALGRAGRLSFWVPLVGGLVAGLVFSVTMSVLLFADPALLEVVSTFGGF